ncbi:hypothetical protein DVR12_21420 [Chitinophaga silvatica]|uniref:Uncharacterized protein n=1 Tax=Chitinophaga silvatica TaxID=2282649 RepID=A0A3E1Y5B2_9BACT|nr:hypothetical protein [Chitinophaga silvatica]RFS19667.1 hypothetical protein DVR12_21420 [Chitinophaga silvatica]
MKKLLAITFLTIYMISTTELSQLLKFPVLVEHYFEHKEINPEMSITDFLALHYEGNHLENHPHNYDYEQDKKLPFMTHNHVLACSFVVSQPVHFEMKTKFVAHQKEKIIAADDFLLNNDFHSSIWQPPKFC